MSPAPSRVPGWRRLTDAIHRAPLPWGLAGSLMVSASSFSVGYLPRMSMDTSPLLAGYRETPWITIAWVPVLVAGVLLLFLSWISLARSPDRCWRQVTVRDMSTAALLWGAPLILGAPLFSMDLFSYIGLGRLLNEGFDPYTSGMSELGNWRSMGISQHWSESVSPYGPLFLGVSGLIDHLMGGFSNYSIPVFKLLGAVGLAVSGAGLVLVARGRGVDPARALWLGVVNPLSLLNFIASAHNDAWMVGFILFAWWAVDRRRPVASALFLAAAISVKPIAVVALPFLGLRWARLRWGSPNHTQQFIVWAASVPLAFAPVAAAGWALGVGWGWYNALGTPGQVFSFFSPVSYLCYALDGLGTLLGLPPGLPSAVVKALALGVTALALTWLALHPSSVDPMKRCVVGFGVLVALSPVIYAWYILWVVMLAAAALPDRGSHARRTVLVSLVLLTGMLMEPLGLSVLVDPQGWVRMWTVGLALVAWVVMVKWAYGHKRLQPSHRPAGGAHRP